MGRKMIEGIPIYGFETLLELAGLASVTMLKRRRKQPADGQKPVAQYWSGHEYVPLYKAADAVDMPPLSPGRQRVYDRNRTCAECAKKRQDPFEVGVDGKRYCSPCQDIVAKRAWDECRARDRVAAAAWAREVLADENVVLAATKSDSWCRHVRVEDLAGTVIIDAPVRYHLSTDPEVLAAVPELADSVSPLDVADRLVELAGRRRIAWWGTTDLCNLAHSFTDTEVPIDRYSLATADADRFGPWYSKWVGKLHAGHSYRYNPRVVDQPPPWEAAEQVARMRELLAEMAKEVADA